MATIEELQAQVQTLMAQLSTLENSDNEDSLDLISEMRYEINYLNSFIQDLSQKSGLLMTIAGLLSFISFTYLENYTIFLNFYIVWIFPFLLLSILFYIISSYRKYTNRCNFSQAENESIYNMETHILTKEILKNTRENYKWSFKWYKASNISLQIFLFTYVFNFYLFRYYKTVSSVAPYTTILLLILGFLMFFWENNSKNKEYENSRLETSTGAGGPDEEHYIRDN